MYLFTNLYNIEDGNKENFKDTTTQPQSRKTAEGHSWVFKTTITSISQKLKQQ